ncbi:MAG: hypothetical protein HUU01_17900 [Saprospiraceae bacterium]|nr:hypothetical protein [Saprospiraceae bacterium]
MSRILHYYFFAMVILCAAACFETVKPPPILIVKPTDGNCVAPAAWFSGKVPTPNPAAFPQDSATNCDFHLISWQYFLWLTEEVNGKLRFETFYSDEAIHPETKDDTTHVLDIVEQALSKGILIDQNGRAVYSNILINDVYRDFVLNNKLYDPEVLLNFDSATNFPVGSMSLKANWKIVQPGEDVSKLYTTKADIELLTMVNGQPRIPETPKIQEDVEVALVALHIAIVVEGHPEFVWATFEFDDNAPDFKPVQGMNDTVSTKDKLFYKANTIARKTNANNAGVLSFVDESKQILTPVTQVARQYANGGGSSTNQGNIEMLNASVKGQLPANSRWRNYFEVGAIWFNTEKGVLKPNWSPNIDSSMVTGSLLLSNATIETFTQKVQSQNECFSCHNTMPLTNVPLGKPILPGKNLITSHILVKNYQAGGEVKRSN